MSQDASEKVDLGALTSAAVRMLRMSHFTIERAADIVLWVDEEGRIRRVNEEASRALGWSREQLLGRPVSELVPSTAPTAWPSFWGGGEADGTLKVETALAMAAGGTLPVEVALSHVDFDGVAFNCAFVRDISERKRAEEDLRRANRELLGLKNRLQQENVYLQNEIKLEHNFEEIVGQSEVLRSALLKVQQVAPTDATVLILGESGTGKELVARAIHNQSPRKDRPLVKVNCAALPASLIESELFGHEKGAFTGALARRIGRFEVAHGGTIFLDEIGDLPLELQAKLLRVLQEGELERLGDPRTIAVDVRVIAATNRDLDVAVADGGFRADLFYRLNVFPVRLPPLRERSEDVEVLARHFAAKYGRKMGKRIRSISPPMLERLTRYSWPGNVRELENVIERAVIVAGGDTLDLDEPLELTTIRRESEPARARTVREVEIELIEEALRACNGVVGGRKGAAARLDVPPSTLRERIQRYGIVRPK